MGMIYYPAPQPPAVQAHPAGVPLPSNSNSSLQLISKQLASAGFQEVSAQIAYRVIASTVAGEKSGKTHFAFTAPGPIACLSTDTGTIEVARKFLSRKSIVVCRFRSATELLEDPTAKVKDQEREWDKWVAAYNAVLAERRIRTLVIDTGTETWELCRLARFGKLAQVMPHHYGPVNLEFGGLIKRAFWQRNDLNVIWLHKTKKEYRANKEGKESWTGRWERGGFGDIPYIVDCNIRQFFNGMRRDYSGNMLPPAFGVEVLDSRHNMLSVVGMTLEAELCSFEFLAESMFPETAGSGFWG